ncbi:serine/threonine protein kinase [Luteimonas chenhongjianii]|uniref:Serine/threonine protein kinase n=2 Tax=Luteimonas chenhongjianii TaxID=2006110 RepID=A0A290XGK2_9GAMM|nr:serine/threonine protein kinase [Luteimonas chenhongjianii]
MKDTAMEHDDLKAAWQSLEARISRSDALQLAVLRETRLGRARSHLRFFKLGHWLQCLLGLGLVALGVMCWTRNPDIAGLLAAGIAVHAFGVINIIGAISALVLAARVDYSAPVLQIQRRLATLLRAYALNSAICGLPWWIMWLPVVVAVAGLDRIQPGAGTPSWIVWSLAISAAGLIATGIYAIRHYRRILGAPDAETRACGDGADGIRRSRRMLAEIAEFEAH